MEPESRSGLGLSAQLNALIIVAVLVPAAAVVGLGLWIITLLSTAGLGSPMAPGVGLDATTLEVVTLTVAMVTLLGVTIPVLRMRTAVRNRVMDLAEVCRQ